MSAIHSRMITIDCISHIDYMLTTLIDYILHSQALHDSGCAALLLDRGGKVGDDEDEHNYKSIN
jgi:hypothetical protein